MRYSFAFFLLLCCMQMVMAQPPQILSLTPNSSSVPVYSLYELDIQLITSASNLHDYDQVLPYAEFFAPSGAVHRAEAFYYQHYHAAENGQLIPEGDPFWKLRFSPNETGSWQYRFFIVDAQGADSTALLSFHCSPDDAGGFLRAVPGQSNLVNDAGNAVFLIGENIGWANQPDGSDQMGYYLEQLHANEMNFAKLIMTPWAYQLEWTEGGLRNYFPRQPKAFLLDSVFHMADSLDIFLMLGFSIHTELNNGFAGEDWSSNPYNIANGGMCAEPWEFFSHPEALAAFKNRIRYILARYSWSTKLVAWNLLSEADNFPWYKQHSTSIANWCNEMADFLSLSDPHHHLVSAGFALSTSNPDVYHHANTHFSQLHLYGNAPDIEGDAFRQIELFRNRYNKPMMVGEFGLGHYPDSLIRWDPLGLSLKNALWTSFMAGAMGAVVPWFWDHYIDALNLYHIFTPLSRFLSNETSLPQEMTSQHLFASSVEQSTGSILPKFDVLTEKAPSGNFVYHHTGQLVPAADSMSHFLFGPLSVFAPLRNPPSVSAFWNRPAILEIETGVQANSAVLQVKIDGQVVLEESAAATSFYQVELPAGWHTVSIDNIGTGFFSLLEMQQINFYDFLPALRGFGRVSNDRAWAWLHNRNHNWKYLLDHAAPPPPAQGLVQLPLPAGSYTVEWFNTLSGITDSITNQTANSNGLALQLDALATDVAIRVDRITNLNNALDALPEVKVFPNPFNDGVSFAFSLENPGQVQLQIFDARGSLLYMHTEFNHRTGTNKISWEGQYSSGQKVSPGIYTYRLLINNSKIHHGKIVRF